MMDSSERGAARPPTLAGAIVCAAAVVSLYLITLLIAGRPHFACDDAYIFLHDAQVLWAGRDSAYFGVPALFGTTSGVFLVLLMLLESIIRSPEMALYACLMIAAISYVLGVYVMCLNAGCSNRAAIALAIGSLVLAGSAFQLLNGMETGLAMSAVAWDFALLLSKRRTMALPVLCGVMPFVRPELAFLAAGSIAILIFDQTASRRFKLEAILVSIASALPFATWYCIETGSPFPSTAAAKAYFFAEGYEPITTKLFYVGISVGRALVATFPLWLCVAFIRPARIRTICLLFIAAFLGAFLLRFPGGLWMNTSRYLFVFAPIVILGVAAGFASEHVRGQRIVRYCLASALLFTALSLRHELSDYIWWLKVGDPNMRDTVAWCNSHLAPGSEILIHDAGYISFAGHFALIDMVGLKTPASIAIHKRLTWPSAGRDRGLAIAQIADSFHPHYLVVLKSCGLEFDIIKGLQNGGWTLTKIYENRASPDTSPWYIYQVYELRKAGLAGRHRAIS
jgi:hypothetical protein